MAEISEKVSRACRNCKWWKRHFLLKPQHICRRFPPSTGQTDREMWPQPREDDWCGEFVQRTAAETVAETKKEKKEFSESEVASEFLDDPERKSFLESLDRKAAEREHVRSLFRTLLTSNLLAGARITGFKMNKYTAELISEKKLMPDETLYLSDIPVTLDESFKNTEMLLLDDPFKDAVKCYAIR
jgi:hypothetical protein